MANPFVKDDDDNPLGSLFAPLAEEIGKLRAERTALQNQVDNLRAHKKEAEDWLAANWQKYCEAKAAFEDIKRRAHMLYFADEAT